MNGAEANSDGLKLQAENVGLTCWEPGSLYTLCALKWCHEIAP